MAAKDRAHLDLEDTLSLCEDDPTIFMSTMDSMRSVSRINAEGTPYKAHRAPKRQRVSVLSTDALEAARKAHSGKTGIILFEGKAEEVYRRSNIVPCLRSQRDGSLKGIGGGCMAIPNLISFKRPSQNGGSSFVGERSWLRFDAIVSAAPGSKEELEGRIASMVDAAESIGVDDLVVAVHGIDHSASARAFKKALFSKPRGFSSVTFAIPGSDSGMATYLKSFAKHLDWEEGR